MNIFYEFKGGSLVNTAKIKEVSAAKKDAVRVVFDDDSERIYNTNEDARAAIERFGKTIAQIIPCNEPLYNVFMNDDGGTYFYERVHFLALCIDGSIRSVDSSDGFFELSDEASNYVGYFNEYRLKDYPESNG